MGGVCAHALSQCTHASVRMRSASRRSVWSRLRACAIGARLSSSKSRTTRTLLSCRPCLTLTQRCPDAQPQTRQVAHRCDCWGRSRHVERPSGGGLLAQRRGIPCLPYETSVGDRQREGARARGCRVEHRRLDGVQPCRACQPWHLPRAAPVWLLWHQREQRRAAECSLQRRAVGSDGRRSKAGVC